MRDPGWGETAKIAATSPTLAGPPPGPSPTATTLVRGASAYALDGAASNDLIPHTARSTSEPLVIAKSSNLRQGCDNFNPLTATGGPRLARYPIRLSRVGRRGPTKFTNSTNHDAGHQKPSSHVSVHSGPVAGLRNARAVQGPRLRSSFGAEVV